MWNGEVAETKSWNLAPLAAITIKPPPELAGMLLADVLQYMTPLVVSVSRSPANALLLMAWDMEC